MAPPSVVRKRFDTINSRSAGHIYNLHDFNDMKLNVRNMDIL